MVCRHLGPLGSRVPPCPRPTTTTMFASPFADCTVCLLAFLALVRVSLFTAWALGSGACVLLELPCNGPLAEDLCGTPAFLHPLLGFPLC